MPGLKPQKLFGPAILVFAGAGMLHLSWFKWPEIIIDYGRELYVPWQITQGKVLYTDLYHLYGPLSHYLNALLFHVFGVGLSTLAYFNIFLITLLDYIIYELFRPVFGSFVATVAGLVFLVVFAFSIVNFVCPYSHEVTYGIFLFFLALLIFRRYLTDPRVIFAALLGFHLGLIFLTKFEIFIAGFISIMSGLMFMFWRLRPPHSKRHAAVFFFSFFLPAVAFFTYFTSHMTAIEALKAISASYRSMFVGPLIKNVMYQKISGLDNPLQNIIQMFRVGGGYLIFIVFTGFAAYLFNHLTSRPLKYGWVLMCTLAFLILAFFINWQEIAKPYPIALLLLLTFLVRGHLLKREDKTFIAKNLPFAVLTLFAVLLLLKIILNVDFYTYGFALAMPASLVMVALCLYYIPMWLARRGDKAIVVSFMGLAVFSAMIFYGDVIQKDYHLKNYPVARGQDRFFTVDPRLNWCGPVVNTTLAYINKLMTEDDTFIVMPEGVMINYLSRRPNPSRFYEFMPAFLTAMGEKNMIDAFSRNLPSFILLLDRPSPEHGALYFGKDYGRDIHSFFSKRYDRVCLIGAEPLTGQGFGIIIAQKRHEQEL